MVQPSTPMHEARCHRSRTGVLTQIAIRVALVLLVALVPSADLSGQQPDSLVAPSLEALGARAVESGSTVGLGLGVYRAGQPILSEGFGYADLEHGVPVTDSTVFRIGSVTKQFTAALILHLIEEDRLSLEDELSALLPNHWSGDDPVTVRQLLNHTSGIPSYTSLGERWQAGIALDLTHEELLSLFRDEPLDFEPGTAFAYNNSGYYLLGMIIEEIAGQPYDQVLEEVIFEPLGLRDSSYCWTRPIIPGRARGYQMEEGEVRNADPLSMTQPFAAGALCSSVRDLATWDRALRTGQVVSLASYERMVTPEGLPESAPMEYGFGLVRGALEGIPKVEHGGGINGFNSALAYYPDEDLTVIALVNLNGPTAGQVAESAARIALGIELDDAADVPLTADERAVYLGRYDIEVLPLSVFEEEGVLMAQGEGQPAFRILYQGDHEFRAAIDPSIRVVFTVEDGRAVAVTVHQAGMQFRGPRDPEDP